MGAWLSMNKRRPAMSGEPEVLHDIINCKADQREAVVTIVCSFSHGLILNNEIIILEVEAGSL